MPASLPVDLNDDRLHDIDVPESFTAAEGFTIDLDNHGEAVHVHLHLDDDLSQAARLRTTNNYVEAGNTRPVEVAVRQVEEPISGKLKIVTGYGTETRYVDVTIEPPSENDEPVQVDESLNQPSPPEPTPSIADRLGRRLGGAPVPVLALAAFAILLAIVVGLVADNIVVLFAAGVVVVGVLAALLFLLR